MIAYSVDYTVRFGKHESHFVWAQIDARDLKSARNKLARKHGVEPKNIEITFSTVVGYY